MQVSVETLTGLERRLTISVPSEQFEDQITDKLKKARGQVKLPGFRPGKVPLKEVRRRFGSGVRAEVAGELMQASFFEAVQQEELTPAGQPNLEVVRMDPGIDFEFTATFEVFPKIELGDFSQIEVQRPGAEITEADIDGMVQELREQRRTFEAVERSAKEEDRVKVDFEGTIDGEPFAGGSGQDVSFEIGKGQMIADFDQGVRGQTAGTTVTIDATFPDDYQAESLRGKTAQFEVTVQEVAEPRLPEMDDEFFGSFGVKEGGGEPAFREEVTANMQRELDGHIRQQIKDQVLTELRRTHSLQLPGAMVHREVHVLKDQMLQQLAAYGQPTEQRPDLPDELFHERAEERVAVGLIMNEIITTHELTPETERVDARLQEIAAPYDDPDNVVKYYRANAEQMKQLELGVLEDQAIDLVLDKASVTEVTGTYREVVSNTLLKPRTEDSETPEAEAASSDEDAAG